MVEFFMIFLCVLCWYSKYHCKAFWFPLCLHKIIPNGKVIILIEITLSPLNLHHISQFREIHLLWKRWCYLIPSLHALLIILSIRETTAVYRNWDSLTYVTYAKRFAFHRATKSLKLSLCKVFSHRIFFKSYFTNIESIY